jgi:hypothetical protein
MEEVKGKGRGRGRGEDGGRERRRGGERERGATSGRFATFWSFSFVVLVLSLRTKNDYENEERFQPGGRGGVWG